MSLLSSAVTASLGQRDNFTLVFKLKFTQVSGMSSLEGSLSVVLEYIQL